MTKINKKILILSAGMISCISMPAYAQWSVADVNLPRYSQAIINELGGVRGNQQNQMKQNSEFQEDTDRRTRIRDGQRLTYERNVMQVPTLQQCAEMTERDFAGASARASGGGSGYNSSGGASKQAPDGRRDSIINNATALVSRVGDIPAMAKNIINLIENDNLRHEIAEKGNSHIKNFDVKSAYEKFKTFIQ